MEPKQKMIDSSDMGAVGPRARVVLGERHEDLRVDTLQMANSQTFVQQEK